LAANGTQAACLTYARPNLTIIPRVDTVKRLGDVAPAERRQPERRPVVVGHSSQYGAS